MYSILTLTVARVPHLMPQIQTTTRPWTFFLPSGCCVYVRPRCCHWPELSSFSPESACASSPAFTSSLGSVQILKQTEHPCISQSRIYEHYRNSNAFHTSIFSDYILRWKSPKCERACREVCPHLEHQSLGTHWQNVNEALIHTSHPRKTGAMVGFSCSRVCLFWKRDTLESPNRKA